MSEALLNVRRGGEEKAGEGGDAWEHTIEVARDLMGTAQSICSATRERRIQ